MTIPTLRPYQTRAVDSVWKYLAEHDGNPCVVLPTGSGKSLCVAKLVHDAVTQWGGRVLVCAHVKELLEQLASALRSLCTGVEVGLYSAGLRERTTGQCTIAGIQSIWKRAAELFGERPPALMIVDEAHLLAPDGEGMYRKLIADLLVINPQLRVIGLTATPYRMGTGMIAGPGQMFESICYEANVLDLIRAGYLSPLKSIESADVLDTSGLHVRGGEYVPAEVEELTCDQGRVAAACVEIIERTRDRKSVLVFASSIAHGGMVAAALMSHGVTVAEIYGDVPSAERAATIAEFRAGRLKYLVNVSVLCLDDMTEILTSDGWVGIDEMSPSHLIAAWDDGKITFDNPLAIVRRWREPGENMVSVEGKNNNIRVTGNHQMLMRHPIRSEPWKKVSAETVAGMDISIPVSGISAPFTTCPDQIEVSKKQLAARVRSLAYVNRKRGMDPEAARLAADLHVRKIAAMQYRDPHDLTIDECKFVGFWLGDGSMSGGRCTFSQSKIYPKIVAWFDALLSRLGMAHSRKDHEPSASVPNGHISWAMARGTGGRDQARDVGYFHLEPYLVKTGSPLYWGLSREQLEALLEGFWLADGNHGQGEGNKSGGVSVSGAQIDLYHLLQSIGSCRGYRVTINKFAPPSNPKHSQQYKISWRLASEVRLMRERLSIETGWMKERVWCVTSSTGNIVTRRKGKVAVMGNTTGFDAPGIDTIVMLRPTKSPGLYYQMCGRGFRKAPDKLDGCLILDFAGNVNEHGPVDRIRAPLGKRGDGIGAGDPPKYKTCPKCQAPGIPLPTRVCPDCGFILITDEMVKHDAKPSSAPLTSDMWKAAPPELLTVDEVTYNVHTKKGAEPGAPRTLRVSYICGLRRVCEYVCFEHGGLARSKAVAWWERRAGISTPCPTSSSDALEAVKGFPWPIVIEVTQDGDFDRITKAVFAEKGDAWEAPDARYVPPISEADCPF